MFLARLVKKLILSGLTVTYPHLRSRLTAMPDL
jgi:hypothetical protein